MHKSTRRNINQGREGLAKKIPRQKSCSRLKRGIFLFPMAFALLAGDYAVADFSLSVTPFEGGSDLRYGKIDVNTGRANKEIIVKVSSDINKQYRVIQAWLEPLTNAEGWPLVENSLFVYGIRGTNSFGTLNVEQEIPIGYSRTLLYTSNTQGIQDSFKLVYGLLLSTNQRPGSYRGRLAFTLEPIDSVQSLVNVILNVFVEIGAESKIRISSVSGGTALRLKADSSAETSTDVLVNCQGGWTGQFRISQLLPMALESPEGLKLPEEAINFTVRQAQKGAAITQATPVAVNKQQAVYTSNQFAEAEDFVITYSLVDASKSKAGKYRGGLKYYLEGPASFLIETLSLEVDIPKVFNLTVIPETGGVMQFRNLKPNEPPRTSEVIMKIDTNVGRPYQVSQRVASEFIDKEGNVIPKENFKLKIEPQETRGKIKFSEQSEVKLGESVLFISDGAGASDSFKIIYELGPGVNLKPGDYATSIVYSISEI